MHPALSVILFTTASGIGYGLAAMLGLSAAFFVLPDNVVFCITALVLSYGLVTAGLLSSTLHLGHPERAWRAFSQWRTSWLSREGVTAMISYIPAGLFGLIWLATGDSREPALALLGVLMAVIAVITVYCTAMIYASLATVHQWHNAWVVSNYLLLSVFSGTLWLYVLLRAWGNLGLPQAGIAIVSGVVAMGAKIFYWRFIDTSSSSSTPESATGLGHLGQVRLFEAPHTESNYLMKEMGFRIARKHAISLRAIALTLSFAVPFSLVGASALVGGTTGTIAALIAAISASVGIFVERWLFFAEAKHTVTLYYGARAA
jgi:sulfite dehydrogenase (quinone) subunit SoeC